MPVGQNLMALFSADFSRDTVSGIASGRSKAGDSGAVAAFSAILAEQTPEDLDALMQQLAQATGADQAALPLPALVAADGKDLPESMQSWFQQLAQLVGAADAASAEDVATDDGLAGDDSDSILAGISEQWQQWLARLPSQEAPADTEAGDGALRRAFEELKQRLRAEGLFDQRHKQEIMEGYHHVGLITSAAGAAICDMVSVFGRRFPATRLTVFPVAVQGPEAPGQISSALALANTLTDTLGLQALIVGRGGGSLEDLQAFNEESVARAIFASELPIVSAVGHEIDFTIADLVADLRAPTPSAAAEVLSPNQLDYLEQLQGLLQRFSNLAGQSLTRRKERLRWMARRLRRPDKRLQDHAQTLDRLELQLKRVLRNRLQQAAAQLALQQRALVAVSPAQKLSQQRTQLAALSQRLAHSGRRHLNQGREQLASLSRNLNAVSPLGVLGRGFSISLTESSQVVRQTTDVAPGQTLVTRLADGTVHSSVTETHPNPSDD